MSGKPETSTLFTFKCRIGLVEGFPVILRTIVQTFFIKVRLLILDTKECQDLRLVDFILRLVLARTIWRFTIFSRSRGCFYFSSIMLPLIHLTDGFQPLFGGFEKIMKKYTTIQRDIKILNSTTTPNSTTNSSDTFSCHILLHLQ